MEARIPCRTPTPGKAPVRIPRWKFDLVARAILETLRAEGELPFRDLPARVEARLSAAERQALGSLSWHVTTVKLELEVRGEIRRSPGGGPQRLTAGH